MLTVNLTYDSSTRLMEVDSISTGGSSIGTIGDAEETRLQFSWNDVGDTLAGYIKRVDFGVDLVDKEGHAYRPYIELDSNDGVIVSGAIMSAVKCGKLPIQLGFRKNTSDGLVEFYSLNIITLAVNKALDALHDASAERNPKFADVLLDVAYNSTTATFTFTRVDGTLIDIALTDLAEDHFEVQQRYQLTSLAQAETGDTATVLSSGVWYKLYGAYNVLDNWKQLPGGAILNDTVTSYPRFYAPTTYGGINAVLLGRGYGNAPVWRRQELKKTLDFNDEDQTIDLFLNGAPLLDIDANVGIECSFKDAEGDDVILPYSINYNISSGLPESITVSSKLHETVYATVRLVNYSWRD